MLVEGTSSAEASVFSLTCISLSWIPTFDPLCEVFLVGPGTIALSSTSTDLWQKLQNFLPVEIFLEEFDFLRLPHSLIPATSSTTETIITTVATITGTALLPEPGRSLLFAPAVGAIVDSTVAFSML